jgi:Txe/YoeB family toxin of Txe-Axe toxin-antitoxin module
MNQVFDNARTKVLSAFPSIYTKDDVIKLIDELQTEVTKQPQTDIATLEELKQNLLETLERKIDNLDSADLVDFDSADFMIGYRNTIEIESIDVNNSTLFNEIETMINDEFDNYLKADEVVNTEA